MFTCTFNSSVSNIASHSDDCAILEYRYRTFPVCSLDFSAMTFFSANYTFLLFCLGLLFKSYICRSSLSKYCTSVFSSFVLLTESIFSFSFFILRGASSLHSLSFYDIPTSRMHFLLLIAPNTGSNWILISSFISKGFIYFLESLSWFYVDG